MNQALTLSNLLNQTFAELRDNGRLCLFFLAILVPINAFNAWVGEGDESTLFSLDFGFKITESMLALGFGIVAVYVIAFIVSIAATYWLYAALMARNPSPGFARFWPWLGIYILTILGVIFGLVLLIVPGIILIVRWSLVLPLVIEGKLPAMDAFGESWARTSGHSWSIFGTFIVLLIGIFVIGAVIGGIATIFSGLTSLPMIGVTAIMDAVTSLIFTALAVAIYRLSSDPTEGFTQVFE